MNDTWHHQWLNGYGNQGLYPLDEQGDYVPAGDYWTVTLNPNGHYYSTPTRDVPDGTVITRMIMRCTVGATNGNDRSGIILDGIDYTYAHPAVVGVNIYDTGEVYLTGLSTVSFGITNLTTASPGSVDSIEVYGIGANPFLQNEYAECDVAYQGIDTEEA
jgi:hypothetical protein